MTGGSAGGSAASPKNRSKGALRELTVRPSTQGILADEQAAKREEIIDLLKQAYWMEIETVMSYIANSVNPDGIRAREIVESLEEDIQEELGHAQQFAARI